MHNSDSYAVFKFRIEIQNLDSECISRFQIRSSDSEFISRIQIKNSDSEFRFIIAKNRDHLEQSWCFGHLRDCSGSSDGLAMANIDQCSIFYWFWWKAWNSVYIAKNRGLLEQNWWFDHFRDCSGTSGHRRTVADVVKNSWYVHRHLIIKYHWKFVWNIFFHYYYWCQNKNVGYFRRPAIRKIDTVTVRNRLSEFFQAHIKDDISAFPKHILDRKSVKLEQSYDFFNSIFFQKKSPGSMRVKIQNAEFRMSRSWSEGQ